MRNLITFAISIIILSNAFLFGQEKQQFKEIKSKRDYYSKTLYNQKDNTYKAQISGNLVHYKDKKGNYLPIETKLVRSTQKEYDFEVTKGVYKVYFKSDITQSFPVKFESYDGYNFQIQPYAIAYMDQSSQEQSILFKVESGKLILQNNIITYSNIFPGIDLKYTYLEKKLKEEIILTEKFREKLPLPSEYGLKDNSAMLVLLSKINFSQGLEIEEQDGQGKSDKIMLASLKDYTSEKKLKFKRNNKIQFMLPMDIAYMQTEDTSYTEQQQKVVQLKRRIRMINKELNILTGIQYIQLQNFPEGNVILDPTVETEFEAVEDVWIENQYNKNAYNFLIIAKTGSYPKKRSLVKFNISSLPSNVEIESANFKLYHHSNGRVGSPTWIDRPVNVHRVLTPWSENTATRDYPWEEGIAYGTFWHFATEVGDWSQNSYASATITQSYKWENFDVTTLVDEWYEGTFQNLGMMIYTTNEEVSSYDVRFRSSEYSDPTYRPILEITYTRDFVRNYYLKDHLGNIRVTIDEEGEVVSYDDYYPFGLQMPGRSMNNALSNNFYKFSGKELDEENGLDWYYFGARYYDPAIARWLQVDPLACKYPSWSPYNYSLNDPIGKRDPDGRFVWGAVIGAVVDVGLQVANNYATGQDLTNIDYGSVAISAAAGLASGGLSSLTKAYKAGKIIAAVGNAAISAGEGAAKAAASGQEITAGGVITDALLGAGASKVGDAVDSKITKTIQNAGDTGVQAGKATQKLQGTRTNSRTSRKTYKKNAANAAKANAIADEAAKKANTAMTLENVGISGAASAGAGNTANAVEEEIK